MSNYKSTCNIGKPRFRDKDPSTVRVRRTANIVAVLFSGKLLGGGRTVEVPEQ